MNKLHFRYSLVAIFAIVFLAVTLLVRTPAVEAASRATDFESYTPGTVNGQDGWVATGSAGSGCALYDHAIVNNSGAPASFGTRSLRISNALTSGCFSDHTFSHQLADEAGETTAENGGIGGGTRQPYFEAQFDVASTVPGAEQPGLNFTVSPDRGDGARMSWVNIADSSTGLTVSFNDYQRSVDNFVQTNIATGLNRSQSHTIRITMSLIEGFTDSNQPDNDIVCVFVDGVLAHQGTSWENYFRDQEGNPTRTVDSLLFRTGGVAAPATLGNGFLVDNFSLFSGVIPPGFDVGCTAPAPTATNTPNPSASPGPTSIAPTMQPTTQPLPLCTLLGGGTNNIVRADATPYQFCRILVENGVYKQEGAEIGDINLINAGVWQAVDIFEYTSGGVQVLNFSHPLSICLYGTGQFYYRDATGQPRTTALLSSWQNGEYTCATINNAGTVVLVGQGI
ncbi:MAG: hypothetical protein IAE89_01185 [Anaerolineae bacterium]|nr:hypothetical protein [Anaerolineae bacterium]